MWFLREMQILRAPFQESHGLGVMSNTLMADSLDRALMFDLL